MAVVAAQKPSGSATATDMQRLGMTGVVMGLLDPGTEQTKAIIIAMIERRTAAIVTGETALARTDESVTGTRSGTAIAGMMSATSQTLTQTTAMRRGLVMPRASGAFK